MTVALTVGLLACGGSGSGGSKTTTAPSTSAGTSTSTTATTATAGTSSAASTTTGAPATTKGGSSTAATTAQDEPIDKAVKAAFTVFFDGRSTVDAKVAAVENGERFRDMLVDASKDPQAAALSTIVHSVTALDASACAAAGVTSPCAEVRHDLFVGTFPAASDKTSYAVKDKGRWVVAATSWCAFVALGGSTCPAA